MCQVHNLRHQQDAVQKEMEWGVFFFLRNFLRLIEYHHHIQIPVTTTLTQLRTTLNSPPHHHHQEVGQEAERSLRARGASGATGRGHGGGREQNRENVDVGRTDENGLIMTVNQILFPSLGIQVSSVTLRMPQHLWIVFQFLLMSSFYKDLLNRQISRYNRSLPWKWTPHPALYFPCGKKSRLLRMRFLLWLWTWGWFGSQKSSNTGREIHCLKLQSSESTCPGTDIWPSSHSFTSLTIKQGKTKSMFVYLYSYCFPQSLFSWSSFSYFRLMDFLFRFLVFLFLHL